MTTDKKKFIIFFAISLVEFILMVAIIVFYYKGIRRNVMLPIFTLVLFQPIFYKKLFNKKKRIIGFQIFLLALFFILLPPYTYNEAKKVIADKYNNEIMDFENHKTHYKNTVPIVESKGIFDINRFYYFSLKNEADEKIIYLMVNPIDGSIIELEEKYWEQYD